MIGPDVGRGQQYVLSKGGGGGGGDENFSELKILPSWIMNESGYEPSSV